MGFDFLGSGNLSRASNPLIPYMVSLLNVLKTTRKENSLATPDESCNRALINRPKRARFHQLGSLSFRTGKRYREDQQAGLFNFSAQVQP